MNNQKDKKVPLPLKVHESVFDEVDQTAKEKGIPRSDEAEYRLKHYATPLTPQLMVQFCTVIMRLTSLWLSVWLILQENRQNLLSEKKTKKSGSVQEFLFLRMMKISFTKDYKNSFSMIGEAIIIFSETVIPFLFKDPQHPFQHISNAFLLGEGWEWDRVTSKLF